MYSTHILLLCCDVCCACGHWQTWRQALSQRVGKSNLQSNMYSTEVKVAKNASALIATNDGCNEVCVLVNVTERLGSSKAMHTNTHAHTCTHTHKHTHTHACTRTHTHTCTHTRINTHLKFTSRHTWQQHTYWLCA